MSRAGWAVMPSPQNLQAAQAWLESNLDGGSTIVTGAIAHVFYSCSGRENIAFSSEIRDLSIILITDGKFSEPMQPDGSDRGVIGVIAMGNDYRREKNLPPASIGIIGIEDNGNGRANLEQIEALLGYMSLAIEAN